MNSIRIMIADDHPLVREGLRQLLATQADFEVVGEACDGVELLEVVRHLKPEVLLLDIAMPRMNGLEALQLMREVAPEVKVILLSMYEKEAYAHQALQNGACGYVLKGAPSEDVLEAVRKVHEGGYYFSPSIHAEMIRMYLQDQRKKPLGDFELLSERERQIFMLLVEGNSMAEIADILCITYKTVEKHRAQITRKLGVSNPVDLVKYAVRLGLVDPDFWVG